MKRALLALAAVVFMACAPARPEPIAYGEDSCEFCRMQISDKRFGAELVSKHGKTRKFDSVDCLIEFYKQASTAGDVSSVWVSDYRHPGTMIAADSARFIDVGAGRTPMGRSTGYAAVASDEDARAVAAPTAAVKRWQELVQ